MSDGLVKRLVDVNRNYDLARGVHSVIREARDRIEALEAERERLALAICGGEDAPGYANSRTVEELEKVARQNFQAHMADIDRLMKAEAERDKLREVLQRLLMARATLIGGKE
jgi:hypothetical protein